MDSSRNELLGELAADASLEHSDFLVQSAAQLDKFLEANEYRIANLGGLVLIDDEADYLAIAPDLTFRSRSRFLDEATGQWKTETEIIETASELVELYNLADVFAAFVDTSPSETETEAEEARAEEGEEESLEAETVLPKEKKALEDNPYAGAADEWAAGQEFEEPAPETEEEAAERLYDLALAFQERSQQTEADLLEQFETAASPFTAVLGDMSIVDGDDERLTLRSTGSFKAEVVPEDDESGRWRNLGSPDEIVEYYDPTDIFGDLADTLAETFPALGEPEGAESEGSEDGEDGEEPDEDGDEGEFEDEEEDAEDEEDGEGDEGDGEDDDREGDEPEGDGEDR